MTQARYGRRDMLKFSAMAAAGYGLAACGVSGQKQKAVAEEDFWQGKKETGSLTFANWPLYIDPKRTQLKQFTKATGISVDYREDVQDIAAFAGKLQPQLANGDYTGYDLIVLTNGLELARFLALGYLAPLDHEQMPNFTKNLGQSYRDNSYDPGNKHTAPYASGITGIAYNPKYVDREITSIADLWDPKFKGKVGMMSDPQEIANFGLLLNGVEPAESTKKDWQAAADKLMKQRDDGIVRSYYAQDFVQPLTNGDVWLTMAWSGDIYQQNAEAGTDLKFVVPEEGATIWTDLMCIPTTSKAAVDSLKLIDFLYRPEIAAGLTEYITYIPPVPKAQDILRAQAQQASGAERKDLEQLVESPLVFPTDEDYSRLHNYVSIEPGKENSFTSVFHAVTQA
ncbi:MAG: extracellular solute-binding protein [Actinophytocola sp.]|nr:extracellular solute-binding protein [Actinophytocola sp.]